MSHAQTKGRPLQSLPLTVAGTPAPEKIDTSLTAAFVAASRAAVEAAWAQGVPVSTLDAHGNVAWLYPDGTTRPDFQRFDPPSHRSA